MKDIEGNDCIELPEQIEPTREVGKERKRKNLSNKNQTTNKWQKLAEKKFDNACELHQLTLTQMQEEHKLKMDVLELQKKKLLLEIQSLKT